MDGSNRGLTIYSFVHARALVLSFRFSNCFQKDEKGLPRRWGASTDISKISHKAKEETAELLGELAVQRLDESGEILDKSVTKVVISMVLEEAPSDSNASDSSATSG